MSYRHRNQAQSYVVYDDQSAQLANAYSDVGWTQPSTTQFYSVAGGAGNGTGFINNTWTTSATTGSTYQFSFEGVYCFR